MSVHTVTTRPQSYDTADGGKIHVYRVGIEVEMEYRTASGRTAATVRMSSDDAAELLGQLEDLRWC